LKENRKANLRVAHSKFAVALCCVELDVFTFVALKKK